MQLGTVINEVIGVKWSWTRGMIFSQGSIVTEISFNTANSLTQQELADIRYKGSAILALAGYPTANWIVDGMYLQLHVARMC